MTSDEAKAQHLIEWATQIAKAAYLIGYAAGTEGSDHLPHLIPLLRQISGQNDTQPQQEN